MDDDDDDDGEHRKRSYIYINYIILKYYINAYIIVCLRGYETWANESIRGSRERRRRVRAKHIIIILNIIYKTQPRAVEKTEQHQIILHVAFSYIPSNL